MFILWWEVFDMLNIINAINNDIFAGHLTWSAEHNQWLPPGHNSDSIDSLFGEYSDHSSDSEMSSYDDSSSDSE
jgi:hypothetical protein